MGYIGFRLGLGAELIKITGTVGGLMFAFRYYQPIGDWIAARSFFGMEWASVLAMAVLAVGGYFTVTRLLRLAEKLMQLTFNKKINSIGGLAAGLVRGLLLTSIVLVASLQLPAPPLQESIEQHSLSGRKVSQMAPAIYDNLTGLIRRLRK